MTASTSSSKALRLGRARPFSSVVALRAESLAERFAAKLRSGGVGRGVGRRWRRGQGVGSCIGEREVTQWVATIATGMWRVVAIWRQVASKRIVVVVNAGDTARCIIKGS